MFTHIVFFKLKDKSQGSLDKAKEVLLSMEGKIPELKGLEVGIDVIHSQRSFDIALITRFDSKEAMDVYQDHPYHVNEILAYLKPRIEGSAAIDFC